MFAHISKIKKVPQNFFSKGYTLLELLVCVIIFIIITAIVMYKYSDFNNNLVMTNQAYELSLSIRQAQMYGLSVREARGDQFSVPYGIRIVKGSSSPFIFADASFGGSGNGIYIQSDNPNVGDYAVEVLPLQLGTVIDDICVRESSVSNEVCGKEFLDITFKRPNPEAIIKVDGDHLSVYSSAKIVMKAPNGKKRNVIVRVTSQISIEVPST